MINKNDSAMIFFLSYLKNCMATSVPFGFATMSRKLYEFRCMYWIILFFCFLSKIIGLAPFSISNNDSKRKCSKVVFSFTVTKMGIIYNLLLACLMIALNYVFIPIKYHSEYFNKTITTNIIEISQAILGCLMISIVVLYYCANHSTLLKIGNDLISIESELRRLRQPISRTRNISFLLVVHLLQLCLCVGTMVTEYFTFQTGPELWITDIVPTMFAGWLFIQYFSMLTLMNAIFVNVNCAMQSLCRNWSSCDRPESLCRSRRVFISSSTIQFILQLRDIQDHLCNVSSNVSEFYSLPTLISLSFLFFTLLYNIYYLLEPLIVENTIANTMILANTVFWIVFVLYPIVLLTTKITNIENEIKKTGTLVHALLQHTIDRQTKAELKQFSFQLLHRKIKFSACGYLNLDNRLMQMILGTTTTYLVILIQFQMSTSVSTICYCNCTQ